MLQAARTPGLNLYTYSELEDIEGVFVNHRVVSMDSILRNNNRVAFFPPGTPGPYRVLLGMGQSKKNQAIRNYRGPQAWKGGGTFPVHANTGENAAKYAVGK